MGAQVFTIGVGVGDEGFFKNGADDVAEGVVNDAIAIGGGGNKARFGVNDLKGGVVAGGVGLGDELFLELDQFGFQVVIEVGNIGLKPFAALGFCSGR